MTESRPRFDLVTVGAYTKDTIVSKTGTRYVDGGGYSYAAHAAKLAVLDVAAVTRLAADDRRSTQLLVDAGVTILQFTDGLLHAKTITVDRDFALVGSVNLDMRSFWINFESTLFVYNTEFTRRLRNLQQQYEDQSVPLDRSTLTNRSGLERFKENLALLIGPLL